MTFCAFCACWIAHTNLICAQDSGGILRDESRLPGSSLSGCRKENGVEITFPGSGEDIPSSESSRSSK